MLVMRVCDAWEVGLPGGPCLAERPLGGDVVQNTEGVLAQAGEPRRFFSGTLIQLIKLFQILSESLLKLSSG